uniref:D-erythro-sphingosine kinase/ diacylglycerol kinase n=1 Tax=Arundo donax TaxID=35708 RepID=A0A0A9EYV3_ARUDO
MGLEAKRRFGSLGGGRR